MLNIAHFSTTVTQLNSCQHIDYDSLPTTKRFLPPIRFQREMRNVFAIFKQDTSATFCHRETRSDVKKIALNLCLRVFLRKMTHTCIVVGIEVWGIHTSAFMGTKSKSSLVACVSMRCDAHPIIQVQELPRSCQTTNEDTIDWSVVESWGFGH